VVWRLTGQVDEPCAILRAALDLAARDDNGRDHPVRYIEVHHDHGRP
jgi:hypothetical protein